MRYITSNRQARVALKRRMGYFGSASDVTGVVMALCRADFIMGPPNEAVIRLAIKRGLIDNPSCDSDL